MLTFQQIILRLQEYWDKQGCALLQPYDMEVGAGTFHTATFLRAIGPEPWRAAYVQPSRRPKDGRYGENPNRLQHYYQYQVVLKPAPPDILDLYLGSLKALGLDPQANDIRFVEDDWESPTLGAWGLGWEVWLNGMEVTQFTYFQEVGSLKCLPTTGEITYGLERLAMYLQKVENLFDPGRHEDAVCALRRLRARGTQPHRGQAGAACLRDGHEVLAHLQPAGCARRHLRHGTGRLHRPGACAGPWRGAGLLRIA